MTPEEVEKQQNKTRRILYASTSVSRTNCRLESHDGSGFAFILTKKFQPYDPNRPEEKQEQWQIVGSLDFSKAQEWIQAVTSYQHDLTMYYDNTLQKWHARCTCGNFHPDWGTTEEITQAFRQHRLDLGLSI